MIADPQIVSLFSGVGGLDMGVQQVIGGRVMAHVEFEAAPSKVLAHRFPGVPNLGDITKVDWEVFLADHPELGELCGTYRPGVVLTGGFPCQDVSLAGLRRGLKDGTRSGLWSEFARAIDVLRPGLVVIENVRGLLSAEAAGVVESDAWDLGDGRARPTLRALGAVLGDLAELGYDARWCGVRAADAGAPHGRFRVFILAYPAGERWGQGRTESAGWGGGLTVERCGSLADSASQQGSLGDGDDVRAGCGAVGRGQATGGSVAADGDGDGFGRVGRFHTVKRDADGCGGADVDGAAGKSSAWHRPRDARGRWITASDADDVRRSVAGTGRLAQRSPAVAGGAAADSAGGGRDGRAQDAIGETIKRAPVARGGRSPELVWGPYAGAVARWQRVLGRVAPSPTEPTGRGGAQRLSPAFVEWMMGWPVGWVTEAGVSRAEQLKILGNGVVPQQAALALSALLEAEAVAA